MVGAHIVDLYQRLHCLTDLKPTIQIKAEFRLIQFLWRTIFLCIEYLLIIMQSGLWLPEPEFGRYDECGIDTILMGKVIWTEDGYLLHFIVDLAHMGKEVVFASKASDKVQP